MPQDIIINLPEHNIIKMKYYNQKRYTNFKEYIKDLENNSENNNKYKISIIYTFSNITNVIEGYDNIDEFNISEIKTENELKNYIEDIKYKNKDKWETNETILIHFEQYNSNKIQYISDYINNYCKKDDYNYIFIIHIQRIFFSSFNLEQNEETIYSIPNIYDNINQLFIDNLNGPSGISLKTLENNNIKDIITLSNTNLESMFEESLLNFIDDELNEKYNTLLDKKNNYQKNNEEVKNKIFEYLNKEINTKKDIIKIALELINQDEKEFNGNNFYLIDKMLKDAFINENTIDIITSLLDFIKTNIFNKNFQRIFKVLDENNFFKTLLELDEDKETKLDEKIFKSIKDRILLELENNTKDIKSEINNNELKEQKSKSIEDDEDDLKENKRRKKRKSSSDSSEFSDSDS